MSKKSQSLMKISRGDTTLEKILAHYIQPEKFRLSEKQEIIRKRWSEVFTLRLNYYSPQQIVNKLVEDHGISLAQAYIDLKNSEILYGNVLDSDRKGKRAILYEYAHKFYQRAIQAKDLKAQAKALELMAEFGGIHDTEDGNFNPDKLKNVTIEFNIPKEYVELLKNKTGVDDFNLQKPIDVEFEELNQEENDEAEHEDR
jgi:hypothetical protein